MTGARSTSSSRAAASFRVVHVTRYAFDEIVAGGCALEVRLEPRGASFHQIVSRPLAARVERGEDELGNARAAVFVDEPFSTLSLTAISVASASDVAPPADAATLARFSGPGPAGPALAACAEYAREHLRGDARADIERFVDRVRADFVFDAGAAVGEGGLDRFFEERRGVCEDFAQLAIACLRARGLPACHASGYVARPVAGGASHAWALVHLPAEGWLPFDPTHGRVGPLGHLTLAIGRDRSEVAPVRGRVDHRGGCTVSTSVTIRALS